MIFGNMDGVDAKKKIIMDNHGYRQFGIMDVKN